MGKEAALFVGDLSQAVGLDVIEGYGAKPNKGLSSPHQLV